MAVCAMALAGAAAAKPLAVGPLGAADEWSREASTNVAFVVDMEKLREFRVSLDARAVSNCVEVCVGCDADGDGVLSVEESDLALGYDRGEWFLRDAEWNMTAIGSVPADWLYRRMKREVVIRAAAFDPSWNMVKVVRRGEDDSDESVAVVPKGTYTYLRIR